MRRIHPQKVLHLIVPLAKEPSGGKKKADIPRRLVTTFRKQNSELGEGKISMTPDQKALQGGANFPFLRKKLRHLNV